MMFSFSALVKLLRPIKIINKKFFSPPFKFSIDSRTIKGNIGFIALKGRFFDGHDFIKEAYQKGSRVIISEKELDLFREIKSCVFLVKNSYKALEKIVKYIRKKKNPFVIAITGSVGKTTTKEMLAYLLEEKFNLLKNKNTENNFLGVSKTFLNLEEEKVVIVELGTSFKGEIKTLTSLSLPKIGIITFIKPAHLEGLHNLKGIFEEKISLIKASSVKQAILNKDDFWLKKVNIKKQLFWFGKTKNAHLYARPLSISFNSSDFLINGRYHLRLSTPFSFYIFNALAALLCAKVMGLDLKESIERLSNFKGFLPLRMQKIKKKNMLFINDSYNSNPFALKEAIKALSVFSLPKIAVLGDMLELGEKSKYFHTQLVNPLLKANFSYILTMGNFSSLLAQRLKEKGFKDVYHFDSHEEIAQFLKRLRKKYLIFVKGSRNMEMERVIEYF